MKTLPSTMTAEVREYQYFAVSGAFFSGVLVIVQDGKCDVYAVEELPDWEHFPELGSRLPPMPRYFLVAKCGPPENMVDEAAGLYCVRISQGVGIKDSCQCFGYNRWQGCKHIDTLADLLKRGF